MLTLNPDIVLEIITRVHALDVSPGAAYAEEPSGPREDWARLVEADQMQDPSLLEVKTAIGDLEPDQQVELVALTWLGRGDYSLEEWDRALKEAGDSWNERTADYLLGTPMVADYLAEGLNLHGYEQE